MRFFRLCNDDAFPMDKVPSEGYESLVEMELQCKKQVDLSREQHLFQLERRIRVSREKLIDKLNKVKMLEQRINKIIAGNVVFDGKDKKIKQLNEKQEELTREEIVELDMHQSKKMLLEACHTALDVISKDIELKIGALNSTLVNMNGDIEARADKPLPDLQQLDGQSAVSDFNDAVMKAFFEKPDSNSLPFFKINTSRIRGGLFGSLSSTHDVANEVASLLGLESCDQIFEKSKQGAVKASVREVGFVLFETVNGADVSRVDYQAVFREQEEEAVQRMRYSPSHDAML